ncbi:MAG: hypothetical protein IH598_07435 [Bacteroidales bacterium]|nr:hypothetical protein [Bacteroidales bacterium]
MKRKIFLAGLFMLACLHGWSQIDKMRDVLDDEMDTENYTIRFFNALDGNPVSGATVSIQNIGDFFTDVEGKIKFPRKIKDGNLLVHFSADDYIATSLNIEVIAGTIFNNRISVSPEMAMEWLRIVLDWGRTPKDLDAHFEKKGKYHVSFRNMKIAEDGSCQLDRDDTKGYGPETITVKVIETEGNYEYWVHDFTNLSDDNSKQLSKSGASVKVYGNGQLLHHFNVPADGRGNVWKIFEIKGGTIEVTNYITSIGNER